MNLQKTIQSLRHIPIIKRILLLVLAASIIPILAIGGYSYLITKSSISSLSSAYNQKLVSTVQSSLRQSFQNYLALSDEFMLSPTVRNALVSYDSLEPDEKYDVIMDILEEVRSKFTRIADIYNIQIVTTDNIPIYNSGFLFLDDAAFDAQFERIRSCRENTLWYITHHNDSSFFVLSRKITNLAGDVIGYITMHIHPNAVEKISSEYREEDIASVTLIDASGESYSSDGMDASALPKEVIRDISEGPGDSQIYSYSQDTDFFINYVYCDFADWELVTATPYSFLNAPVRSIGTGILAAIFLCIVISGLVSRCIGRSITAPITKMVQSIQALSNQELQSQTPQNNDELEFLSNAYVNILDKIQDLTEKVQQEQEEKRKAEIQMLQAQINPHFLFNTLDSLKFTALMSNAPTVSEGLTSLSRILRNSVIDGKSFITVASETKNIEDYLTIQRIRHGEIIDFHCEIGEEAGACRIMKFLLQPLVENSVIHGIQEDRTLQIDLHICLQDDMLHITLSDNGRGFDVAKQYDPETDRFKSSKMSGIGLENVRQRLRLEYGDRQKFTIESTAGEGTVVEIVFPAVKEN